MATDNAVPTPEEMEEKYAQVPADFPRTHRMGSIGGAQPKILATAYNGKIYAQGCTPPELYSRWDVCEDLAVQFAAKSKESKAGKRSHMAEVDILDQYLPRLIQTKWTSEAEARWVIKRAAEMLGWPVPAAANTAE